MHTEWPPDFLHPLARVNHGHHAPGVLADRAAERADVNYLSVPLCVFCPLVFLPGGRESRMNFARLKFSSDGSTGDFLILLNELQPLAAFVWQVLFPNPVVRGQL